MKRLCCVMGIVLSGIVLIFAVSDSSAQSEPTPNVPPVMQTLTALPVAIVTSTPAPPLPLPSNITEITHDNYESIQTLREISAHIDGAWNVAFSPDGNILATSGRDHAVRLWDVDSGELLHELTDHSAWVIGIDFSPDGSLVATGESGSSADNRHTIHAKIRLWDVETGELIREFSGHTGGIWSVRFSPNGTQLVSASFDGTVMVWDSESGDELHSLTGHYRPVLYATFSPDGTLIASGGADSTIRLWDVESGEQIDELRGHRATVGFLAFNSDGHLLASSGDDSTVRLWDMETRTLLHTLDHDGWVNSAIFSHDESMLISGSRDLALKVWDVETGELLTRLPGHSAWVMRLAINPNGTLIASAAWDNTVRLWGIGDANQHSD